MQVGVNGRRSIGSGVRRWGLRAFFAAVSVNAVLGIYAILAPGLGELQGRILATSVFVTGAILAALACEPAWQRRLLGIVPYAGALLAAAGFAMSTVGIWTEATDDVYGRALGTVFVAAAACIAASLLILADVAERHQWVVTATLVLLALSGAIAVILPWLGDDPPQIYVRTFGVILVMFAAFAVSLPVLHWIDRADIVRAGATGTVLYCPGCGGRVDGRFGATFTCPTCEASFTVISSHGTRPSGLHAEGSRRSQARLRIASHGGSLSKSK